MPPSDSVLSAGPTTTGAGVLTPGPAAPSPAAPAAKPTMRGFDDVDSLRGGIYDSVFKAVSDFEPVANATHTVKLSNPRWVDPADVSRKDRKRAILRNESLGRRLQAEWHLVDNATGQPVASRRSIIATVPKLTDGGTFVQDGIEYTLANQFRLLPGVYTRRKSTGETESHVNTLPGQGVSHRYSLDPAKSVFKMEVGQSSVPLLPVLRALGATDDQLREAWGDKLLAANLPHDTPEAMGKLYDRLLNATERKAEPDKVKAVAAAILKMKLDPAVTTRTLGRPHATLGVDAILDSTRRLLSVYRGEADPDDRDAMPYQKLMAPDDLMAERIRAGRSTVRKLLWKATNKKSLAPLPTGLFDGHIKGLLQSSGLGNAVEEVNPTEMLGQLTRVTRLGEGGISGGVDSVPEESRNVHSSQLGYVDPVLTPECYDSDTEVMTESGWKFWREVTDDDKLACMVEGRLQFNRPIRLIAAEYNGLMFGARGRDVDYLVTPNHRMWVRCYDPSSIGYRYASAADIYGRMRCLKSAGHLPLTGVAQSVLLPPIALTSNNMVSKVVTDPGDWAELIGWVLSEGCFHWVPEKGQYNTHISQCRRANPNNHRRIGELLSRLPFAFNVNDRGFTLVGKQLASYVRQFGFCNDKFIPRDFFAAPEEVRRRLYEAMLLGDGRKAKLLDSDGLPVQYCTTSKRLADDFAFLAFTLGRSARIVFEPDDREERYLGCYVVHIHTRTERVVRVRDKKGESQHYKISYSGMVYCAEVPGHLLYVRRHNSIGIWCGNSSRAGVDLKLARAARRGSDGKVYTPVRDVRTGEIAHKSPLDLADEPLAFPGEMKGDDDVVTVVHNGKIDRVPRSQVRYEVPHMEHTFNQLANLVPGKSAIKGQRAIMGARMMTQAMALRGGESRLVRAGDPESGDAFDKLYGSHVGAVRADQPGRVTEVTDDRVTVRGQDGKEKTFELHNNLPYNRKSFLHQTATVQPGQEILPGDLLARSNYTDDQGHVALGRNLYSAYLPDGNNFEDAVTISASAARDKMASEHLYQHSAEHSDDVKRGKNSFAALMPSAYSRAQMAVLDDDGVIKPGTVVEKGQPLVLGARLKSRTRTKILRGGADAYSNGTEEWDHHNQGVVTDVEKTPKGVVVAVKSYNPMIEGDKLCYDPKTEVLTSLGWKPVAEVTAGDLVATLVDGTRFEYLNPVSIQRFDHAGRMYRLKTTQVDLLVTDNHKLYAKPRNPLGAEFGLHEARDLFGKRYRLKKNGAWTGASPATVTLPATTVLAGQYGRGSREMPPVVVRVETYAMLLGMFLSEGNVFSHPESGSYGFDISQFKAPNVAQMLAALDAAGVRYNATPTGVRVYGLQWCQHFKQFGKSHEKFIPVDVFDWGVETLKILYRWLMWGDGSEKGTGHSYCTTSGRLADDVQRLALHIGMSARIKCKPASRGVIKGKEYDFRPRYDVHLYREKNEPEVNHGHRNRQSGQTEEWVDYVGSVHCVTMPRGHVIYIRRDGKTVWCGNSGTFGDKGLVKIVPDEHMPHDSQGRPFEVLLNPLGVQTRGNPIQVYEAVLSKIAKATGKPYTLNDFGDIKDLQEFTSKEAEKHNIPDTETVTDPRTGAKIPGVLTGYRYLMKLHHSAEDKDQGRGLGGYGSDGEPSRGSGAGGGAKRFSVWDTWAMLSHGALAGIKDAKQVRGQKNEDYWAMYQAGHRPPDPDVPHSYKKFVADLQAAGINPVRKGTRTRLLGMTDKDVDALTEGRTLRSAESVNWNEGLDPVPGGLFDTALTGGHSGSKWAALQLHEPVLNPVFEDPARRLLGLTKDQLRQVMSGQKELNGQTGPAGLQAALKAINVPQELDKAKAEFRSGKKTRRDEAVKKWALLAAADKHGVHPGDWVMSKVPVLPPMFRPVSLMQGNGRPMTADANLLYKELFDANHNLKQLSDHTDQLGAERLALYDAFKGVVGLGDPTDPKNKERGVTGVLKGVFGSSPKYGAVNRKLLGTTVDTVGRSVIVPNADLDMDQAGIPEEKAWDVFKPFVVRRLARQGLSPVRAAEMVTKKDPVARRALQAEMEARPVRITRAPILHRYGTMAFRPVLVPGHSIHLPPVVYKGFGADNDGDQVNYHVPVSDDAVKEDLERLLPSKNLFNVRNFAVHQSPQNEFLAGLYEATQRENDSGAVPFDSVESVVRALRRGHLRHDQKVTVPQ